MDTAPVSIMSYGMLTSGKAKEGNFTSILPLLVSVGSL